MLLHSKSLLLIIVLDSNLKKDQSSVYIFKNITENIIIQFIKWIYWGDYPVIISRTNIGQTLILLENTEIDINKKSENITSKINLISENHFFLIYICLYIFSKTYLVPDLQQLAYKKLTTCLTDLDKLNSFNT